MGIFEAGISLPNEMSNLENIIQPKYGILTNIGSVHDEGFTNREAKIKEKIKLFENCSDIFLEKNAEIEVLLPYFGWMIYSKFDISLGNEIPASKIPKS
ncbi:MAG: Mur ligase family protein [Flavobacterium sp.]